MAAVIRDITKQNWMCVLYTLSLFSDGIRKYFEDQFILIHRKLKSQNQHLQTPCTISCSKKYQNQINWCSTCSSWKTSILSLHRSPSARKGNIDWKQFDSSKWPTDPMEVKKSFEPDWCRSPGSNPNPNLLDISIIIGCMSNCSHFVHDIRAIREIRNTVSHNNRLTHENKKTYCQTLIDFLQHSDIWKYQEAKDAFNDIVVFRDTTLEMIFENHLLDEIQLYQIESKLFLKKTFLERIRIVVFANKELFCSLLFFIFGVLYMRMCTKQDYCTYGYQTEFKSYIDQHDDDFTGREWLFNGIEERLNSFESGLILVAELGFGKTAAISQIINRKRNIGNFDVFPYLCRSDVRTLQQASPFLLDLFQHLLCNYPSFRRIVEEEVTLENMKNLRNSCKFDPIYCLDRLVIDNLLKMEPPTGRNLLMLIDALDECKSQYNDISILSILRLRHKSFPGWVRFLLTSRNDSVILSDFQSLSKWHLLRSSEENKKDVIEFVRKSNLATAATEKKIASQFEYNFFFTKFVLRYKNHQEGLAPLPLTLHDAFQKEFNRLFDNCKHAAFRKARFVLEVLVASFQPLKMEELFNLVIDSDIQLSDKYEFEEMLQDMLPHILQMSENGYITFSHSVLVDWLTYSGRRGHPCFVDKQIGYKTITHQLLKKIKISGDESDHKSVNWLIYHLYFANDTALFEKFKGLQAGIVDKKMPYAIFNNAYVTYVSCLERAAMILDSYIVLKTILTLSESKNVTKAAILSVVDNNIDSLRAILEYGYVDVSAIVKIYDPRYDININMYKQKEALTILHFAIVYRNWKAFKLIVAYNSSALHFKTGEGVSVLQGAVLSGDFQILDSYLELVPDDEGVLPLATFLADNRIVKLLLQHGIKDVCLKCESNIFIRKNREIYFEKYNKTISIDRKRWLKDNGEVNHLIDIVVINFAKDITCESVLHTAIREGNVKLVHSILRQSTSTIECVDFQGLTPLGGAVIFKQHDIVKYLLDKGANLNFVCNPTDVISRVNMLRQIKLYSVFYTDLNMVNIDEYCPKGKSIGHLIRLSPTCDILKIILRYANIREVFYHKHKNVNNPLYYLLCHKLDKQNWGNFVVYNGEFVSSNHIQVLLFLIGSQHGIANYSKLLIETGLCGNKLQMTIISKFQPMCHFSPDRIPDIGDLFIKINNTIYKRGNIRNIFPIKKGVKVKIMYNIRFQKTKTIISFKAFSPQDSEPSSMLFESIFKIAKMSRLLEKLEHSGDKLKKNQDNTSSKS